MERFAVSLERPKFYIGSAADSTLHAIHDVTICVALHGSFRLWTSAGWREFQAAIIPPDLPHIFDGRGARLILFYFLRKFSNRSVSCIAATSRPSSRRKHCRAFCPFCGATSTTAAQAEKQPSFART
jgi:hypothetical protein